MSSLPPPGEWEWQRRISRVCLMCWQECPASRSEGGRVMALKTHGTMAVDWEQRIDFDRLRRDRLAKAKALLAKSEMGALLCFDMNNVRYLTSTHIGTWAQDRANLFKLLTQYV